MKYPFEIQVSDCVKNVYRLFEMRLEILEDIRCNETYRILIKFESFPCQFNFRSKQHMTSRYIIFTTGAINERIIRCRFSNLSRLSVLRNELAILYAIRNKIIFQQYANIAQLLRRRNYFLAISFICPGDLTNASKIPVRSYQSRRLLIFLYLRMHENDWTSSLPIAFLITVCLLSFHGDRARRSDRQDRIGCRERFKSPRR